MNICMCARNHIYALARMGPGSIVGQASLLDRQPRLATVRAISQCVAMELERDTFEQLMRLGNPFAIRFQHDMAVAGAKQLRLTTRRILILRGLEPVNDTRAPRTAPRAGQRREASATEVLEDAMRETNLDLKAVDAVEVVEPVGQMSAHEKRKRRLGH